MKPGKACIHLLFPEAMSPDIAFSRLTEEEKSRANRFHFLNQAHDWISCRAQLREILGRALQLSPQDVPLVFTEYGKPLLAPPYDSLHFNLSHGDGLSILVLCQAGPVGIDLLSHARAHDLLECETTFCHPEELNALPNRIEARCFELLRIWTAKEALLKALGTGLSHPPETVQILFQSPVSTALSNTPMPGMVDQRLHELRHSGLGCHHAYLSAPASVDILEFI